MKMVYTAIGDSITEGKYLQNKDTDAYCSQICNNLSLDEFQNLGVSGTTMGAYEWDSDGINLAETSMVNRYTQVSVDADIISIMAGTNDHAFTGALGNIDSTERDTFYGAYKETLNWLISNRKDAFIFVITPLPNRNMNTANARGYVLEDYVNAIKEISTLYNIPCLDLYTVSGFDPETQSHLGDGTHPNQDYITNHLVSIIQNFIEQNVIIQE